MYYIVQGLMLRNGLLGIKRVFATSKSCQMEVNVRRRVNQFNVREDTNKYRKEILRCPLTPSGKMKLI